MPARWSVSGWSARASNDTVPRAFEWVDVFTATPGGGNPLPVVLDAEGLTAAQMQAVAREFNTVETTFVLPPVDPAHTAQIRIFTPKLELPFAGHPNVGTAYVLARRGTVFGRPVPDLLLFEEQAGIVPVQILRDGAVVVGASFQAPAPFTRGPDVSLDLVAGALGLDVCAIETSLHGPLVGSVGLPFVLVALQSRAALAGIRADAAGLARLVGSSGTTGVLAYAPADGPGACDFHARMFCLQPNLIEDPATGSANAALVALRASLLQVPQRYMIGQGAEMGRPSLLQAWTLADGTVHVGGHCAAVLTGHLAT